MTLTKILPLVSGVDMLLVGNEAEGVTNVEGQTQMAIWSILAAPLIMGNDVRRISDEARSILLNEGSSGYLC